MIHGGVTDVEVCDALPDDRVSIGVGFHDSELARHRDISPVDGNDATPQWMDSPGCGGANATSVRTRRATLSITLSAPAGGVSTVGDRPAEVQQALQYNSGRGPCVAGARRPRARQIAQFGVRSSGSGKSVIPVWPPQSSRGLAAHRDRPAAATSCDLRTAFGQATLTAAPWRRSAG